MYQVVLNTRTCHWIGIPILATPGAQLSDGGTAMNQIPSYSLCT